MTPSVALLLAWLGPLSDGSASTAPPAPKQQSPEALAELIDRAFFSAWQDQKLPVAEVADDATWLRRLSIDLCGTIPEREEVASFLADTRRDKRTRKIDEYLNDRSCAENLSYLWANELLAGAMKQPEGTRLRPWLEQAFARNTPFADMTRELIAGTGRNDENGATSFVLAYTDEIEALSAVTARTFLGLQIQCAQCHDHPLDHWKQTDFNGFTGFFLGVRGNRLADGPGVMSLTDVPPEEMRHETMRKLKSFARNMAGQDGDAGEMKSDPDDEQHFQDYLKTLPANQRERVERNHQRQELFKEARYLGGNPFKETPLLTRRAALAEWIVDPENPWFAKAVVNRLWGHFFGKGLTDPVDDLSGSQDAILPQLLATIAEQFRQGNTDVRYLLSAFARTRVYALGNSLVKDPDVRNEQERWFAAHPLRPFTAEQVLHSLMRATATEEKHMPRSRGGDFEVERNRLLEKFRYVFNDDEGGDAERFASSIPQALFLMNGRMTNDDIRLRNSRMLDGILDETRTDRDRLRQIFYATLNRPPSQREAEKLGRLVRGSSGGGKQGIEDLYWALLNSTEFLTNH